MNVQLVPSGFPVHGPGVGVGVEGGVAFANTYEPSSGVARRSVDLVFSTILVRF